MPTIPATYAPRQSNNCQVHYFRKIINFNDANIGSASTPPQFGSLPLNAYITQVEVHVLTAFNAATTNVLTVGVTPANANELVAAADVTPGTPGIYAATRGKGLQLTQTASALLSNISTAEGGVGLWYKYTQTGTAATAGQAVLVIAYIPNNDG